MLEIAPKQFKLEKKRKAASKPIVYTLSLTAMVRRRGNIQPFESSPRGGSSFAVLAEFLCPVIEDGQYQPVFLSKFSRCFAKSGTGCISLVRMDEQLSVVIPDITEKELGVEDKGDLGLIDSERLLLPVAEGDLRGAHQQDGTTGDIGGLPDHPDPEQQRTQLQNPAHDDPPSQILIRTAYSWVSKKLPGAVSEWVQLPFEQVAEQGNGVQ